MRAPDGLDLAMFAGRVQVCVTAEMCLVCAAVPAASQPLLAASRPPSSAAGHPGALDILGAAGRCQVALHPVLDAASKAQPGHAGAAGPVRPDRRAGAQLRH